MVDVNAAAARSRIERSPKDKILPIDCLLQPTWPTNKIDILYIGVKSSDFYVVFVLLRRKRAATSFQKTRRCPNLIRDGQLSYQHM